MRLHRYRGKENGLMVIGSPSELRALGESLIAAAEYPPKPLVNGWPPAVAKASVTGSPGFFLSFHLEALGETTPKSNLP